MVLQWATKILRDWSAKGIVQRLDRRRLQHELDTHKLFLLTSYDRESHGGQVPEAVAEELAQQAESLKFEGMQAAVARNLVSQLLSLSGALHSVLQQAEDPMPAARGLVAAAAMAAEAAVQRAEQAAVQREVQQRPQGKGMAFAFGAPAPAAPAAGGAGVAAASAGGGGALPLQRKALSAAELAAAFRGRAGFTLRVAPSAIAHAEAGDGLWIEGWAPVGQIVALYPGVAYSPLQYRQIPGYPKIDRDNPYFIGRFDGVVLDAKPWGRGLAALGASGLGSSGSTGSGGVPWLAAPRNGGEAALGLLEGRHPLALGHFANHPPAGAQPNVMVASFDFQAPEGAPELRAYIPNAALQDSAAQGGGAQGGGAVSPHETVTGLALVALRDLGDEEIFLNYRLTPHVTRPDWYTPVDEEEERRRWA